MPHIITKNSYNSLILKLAKHRLPITLTIIIVGIAMSVSNHMGTRAYMSANVTTLRQADSVALSSTPKSMLENEVRRATLLNIIENTSAIRNIVAIEVIKVGGKAI